MKVIAQVKLTPTPEQADALKHTLEAANAACDYLSRMAWETKTFSRYPLQRLAYRDVREQFALGAQMTIRCIAKVADAYALDRETQRTFQPHGAIAFDDRNLYWYNDKQSVTIWTVAGRQRIRFSAGERQLGYLAYRQGESDLVYHRGAFYVLAVCDLPEPMCHV